MAWKIGLRKWADSSKSMGRHEDIEVTINESDEDTAKTNAQNDAANKLNGITPDVISSTEV